ADPLLSVFDVPKMDIAALEVAAPKMVSFVAKKKADLIADHMMHSLHITFILSVPFLGAALLITLLYKHHHAQH
ncbi:hypothetical protein EC988_004995, partial [Linderina pennispora]